MNQTDHIAVNHISPSPFQHRKYFNEEKLRKLAASIQREGLIQPIIVRPSNGRYELIAGERRLRAVKDYTDMNKIVCSIVDVNDFQARRMSAAENLHREDLSTIEMIEAIVESVDAELIEDKAYVIMGKTPLERVKTVLRKIDSARRSRERGFSPEKKTEETSNKFIRRVEKIFNNLSNPMDWLSFFKNDLPLLMDFCQEVRDLSDQHHLNKSQIRALAKLKETSEEAFENIVKNEKEDRPIGISKFPFSPAIKICDLSAREIEEIANKAIRKEIRAEQNRLRIRPQLNAEVKIFLMSRLGIPIDRIAVKLKLNRKTAYKYANHPSLVQSIEDLLKKRVPIPDIAKKIGCPEPLIWSIALEGKSDQERFRQLNWGLRTWDYWYYNDIDHRFGDDWPGRIPAQLVAHSLFYLTREGDLVFDPMAGGGAVPDTCLAFHRKCWSFDLTDRPETRPEIEAFKWNPDNLLWPVKGKEKPDLIFFDAPYFTKMAAGYSEDSISNLSKNEYMGFFRDFFLLAREHVGNGARMAFLNADWRDFQGVSVLDENAEQSIFISDYIDLLKNGGWEIRCIVDCPLSTQRFHANMVKGMQKNRTLGTVRRSLIIAIKP